MHYPETAYRNNLYRFKGFLFKLYLLIHGCKVGKNLKCMAFPKIRAVPRKNINIGNNVTLGRNVTLEIIPSGKLILEDYLLIADNVIISSSQLIHIKKWSAVAENSSIRDHFHLMKKGKPYRLQKSKFKPVVIGEDCGIGAGSVVLMGSEIPDGVFVGANSVVTSKDELKPFGLYRGDPLEFIRFRE